jgi:IS30 family transposase
MKPKKYVGLCDAERSEIEILLRRGCSIREIAEVLHRSPNTISREIKVNSVKGEYRALKAKQKSRVARRSRRYQWRKIEHEPALRQFIIEKLSPPNHWSPDELSGYLKHQQTVLPYVSSPQIYAWLYSSYGQPYCQHLYSHRYHAKRHKGSKTKQVIIPDRISIAKRPKGATNRTRYGHWEGDTMVSGKKTGSKAALAVFVERKTRLAAARLMPNLKPASFADAAVGLLGDKQALSVSLDNGIENRQHQAITAATGADAYFCDPYSSWQKGGVESLNKLLRRYMPKSTDLSRLTQAQVDDFVATINNKPRRCLGFRSALQLAEEKGILRK